MEFHKVLAKYYHQWFRDCHDSATYCKNKGEIELANTYLRHAKEYQEVILDNYDAIEFFSVGDRAFLIDSALPVEFRGYR